MCAGPSPYLVVCVAAPACGSTVRFKAFPFSSLSSIFTMGHCNSCLLWTAIQDKRICTLCGPPRTRIQLHYAWQAEAVAQRRAYVCHSLHACPSVPLSVRSHVYNHRGWADASARPQHPAIRRVGEHSPLFCCLLVPCWFLQMHLENPQQEV